MIRNEINAGRLPGPRLRAASPEITVTAGLGDERKHHMYYESFGMIADGPEEIARVVRLCCREGVDNIKINISGDDLGPKAHGGVTVMREAEVQMAVDVARDFGKRVNCHARAAASVKRGVRCGVDVDLSLRVCADEEALDMLESRSTASSSGRRSASSTARSTRASPSASRTSSRSISACSA